MSERARNPLANRSWSFICGSVIVLLHRVDAGIAGDLGVEDGKAGLKLGHTRPDFRPMPFKQNSTFLLGCQATLTQVRVAQHLPDRHAGRLEAAEKVDPYQDGGVVVASMGGIAGRTRKQADPLVILIAQKYT
jgi:hypothetical protein